MMLITVYVWHFPRYENTLLSILSWRLWSDIMHLIIRYVSWASWVMMRKCQPLMMSSERMRWVVDWNWIHWPTAGVIRGNCYRIVVLFSTVLFLKANSSIFLYYWHFTFGRNGLLWCFGHSKRHSPTIHPFIFEGTKHASMWKSYSSSGISPSPTVKYSVYD